MTMSYAEAVKVFSDWMETAYLPGAADALAVLRGAEKVMGAVEGANIKTLLLWQSLHGPDGEMESLFRAAAEYQKGE